MCVRDYAKCTSSTTRTSVRIDITKKQYMAQLSHVHFVQASESLLSAGFHLYESQHDSSGVPAERFQQPPR